MTKTSHCIYSFREVITGGQTENKAYVHKAHSLKPKNFPPEELKILED